MPSVMAAGGVTLSPRQRQILEMLAAGRSRGEIAAELFVAPGTVSGYCRVLYAALGVHSAPEAIAAAHRLDILPEAAVARQSELRRVLELVLSRDFEAAYGLAVEVAAQFLSTQRQDAAAAGARAEAGS